MARAKQTTKPTVEELAAARVEVLPTAILTLHCLACNLAWSPDVADGKPASVVCPRCHAVWKS